MDLSREELEEVEQVLRNKITNIAETPDFQDPQKLYEELMERVRKYHPSTDLSLIERAYETAYRLHDGQMRKSGEPYIIHPLSVARILADLELDKETIAAGLLHDVLEDTAMTEEEMRAEFGDEVVLLVNGVTKLKSLHLTDGNALSPKEKSDKRLEMQAENLRKMFLAMAKDIRVILIKLADRLHNMRTLKYQKEESRIRIARETQDIYCPLCQRLGISKIKVELEDLSMKYLYPEAYYDLVETIASTKAARNEYVQGLVDIVDKLVADAGIHAKVYGRAKHFFSIYKKMVNQNKTIDEIYDLFAIRVVVDNIQDCYAALGILHANYKPIPGRFKDYIAMPKQNMYQSLHTTLIGKDGPFEIQIRTYEMHRTAEYGIAAHWKYKEQNNGNATHTTVTEEEKLSWLRQILEWQQSTDDNKEFMSALKNDLDLFSETVFAFTPTGEIKNLPSGSTPIDFAYAIHSQVGNKMVGAKVNGKLVPIDYVIRNGDRIDIITSQNSKGPSTDWLDHIKSTQARNKIQQFFRAEKRVENIQKGRDLMVAYAKVKGVNLNDLLHTKYQDLVMQKYGLKDWDTVLASIGNGHLKETQVINRMYDAYLKDHPVIVTDEEAIRAIEEKKKNQQSQPHRQSRSGVIVRGLGGDVAVHFSKCCSPVPGDDIIGYITRGRGLTIHRKDCVNIRNLSQEERLRLEQVEWDTGAEDKDGDYSTNLRVFALDRKSLALDVIRTFSEADISINSIHTNTNKQGVATLEVSFVTRNRSQLFGLIGKLRQIDNVLDVVRTNS